MAEINDFLLPVGEFTHSIDKQRRVAVPKSLRTSKNYVIVPSRDNVLLLFDNKQAQDFFNRLSATAKMNSRVAAALRTFSSKSIAVSLDAQGRIGLSQWLVEYANLAKQVVFVAAPGMVQILSVEKHNELLNIDDALDVVQELEEQQENSFDLSKLLGGEK